MNLRRAGLDVAVVAVLAAATAAYVREPGGWSFFSVDESGFVKFGGQAVWQSELLRWWIATAVGMTAMLVRSWLPIVALTGAVAMTLVHVSSQFLPLLPLDAATPIALFSLAAGPASRRISYAALGVTLGLSFAPALWVDLMPAIGRGGTALAPPAAVALSWILGDRSRARQQRAARRTRDLEHERDQQADIATAAERARIARELHDAVAHGLSIIVIQAQAGAGALGKRPSATWTSHDTTARAALEAIETTGRESLTEMRRLLGLDRPDEADLAPLPGPIELPALVARVRAAGLPTDLRVTGNLATLPTGVGLSAYRIIQEALTNALKHAGSSATVHIEVCRHPDAVELSIADTGRGVGGPPDERRGNGLRGMRERVALLGGTLTAGDNPAGGFHVRARLPLAVAS